MKYYKNLALLSIVTLFQSCKTPQTSNSSDTSHILAFENNKINNYNHYYFIHYNQIDTNDYTAKEVKQIDSITIMKEEFQKLLTEVKAEKIDPEIDTISKYKLKFISENYKNENLRGLPTQNNVLKKCDQMVNLKYFIKSLQFTKSYSKKYLVVFSIPIVEIGNTYTKSSNTQYYFEKITAAGY